MSFVKNKLFYTLVFTLMLIFFIFIFAFTGCSFIKYDVIRSNEKEADSILNYNNDFTLLDLNKNEVSLHEFKGKLVVLNFWATWCPPCRDEIPDFVEVYNLYKNKNVQFIGVADDDVKSLVDFVAEYKVNYPILVDGTIDRVFARWDIDAIPHTFVLDGNGNIIFDQLGMMTKHQLIGAIENSLSKLD